MMSRRPTSGQTTSPRIGSPKKARTPERSLLSGKIAAFGPVAAARGSSARYLVRNTGIPGTAGGIVFCGIGASSDRHFRPASRLPSSF
jgi:hypothetical protein